MLFAASESAVTKKPRLRLMMRRSSSVRPLGSFQSAMSRLMFTSCGIQWLAQVARYFSQAHLYLKGTSWLSSVWPLMMRLSAAFTRRAAVDSPASWGAGTLAASRDDRVAEGIAARGFAVWVSVDFRSSSQSSMVCFLSLPIISSACANQQELATAICINRANFVARGRRKREARTCLYKYMP